MPPTYPNPLVYNTAKQVIQFAYDEYEDEDVKVSVHTADSASFEIEEEVADHLPNDHENLMECLGVKYNEMINGTAHDVLVYKLIAGVSLEEYRNNEDWITYNQIVEFAGEIKDGLHELHNRNICHNDIKDENIMVNDEGTAVIVDYDLSYFLGDDEVFESYGGSDGYKHPLVGTGETLSPDQVDFHALGFTLYELATNSLPSHVMEHLELAAMYDETGELSQPIQNFFCDSVVSHGWSEVEATMFLNFIVCCCEVGDNYDQDGKYVKKIYFRYFIPNVREL
ncbi:protein kinase domain-containing protein [Ditylenchus destructor]|uniref:Protein kinase domain-containing protein n=1 Tax=Ditylenchus destructor TaxID=166010 RepID=A0AAD4MUC4_9BILA|nr:protein kinase domain-containing protein [Ditylenchus destructor]